MYDMQLKPPHLKPAPGATPKSPTWQAHPNKSNVLVLAIVHQYANMLDCQSGQNKHASV
jgi:hypothetical protein